MKRPPGKEALERQRRLRRERTEPEKRLWSHLRGRQVADLKFRQQVWLGPYIVDFFCAEARLVIELDGETHVEPGAEAYDERRTAFIEAEGYRVRRFWNNDVMQNTEGVVAMIEEAARESAPHPPTASRRVPPSPLQGEGC
ncbi:MAG: methylase [Sphingomonas bacterium]|uniref:endonuclease domain-containing protein n=1 Tax=Sphingomonas bacterium TaxID=1895847 RepID=UPI0026102521|nr:endonuclease domain-containing protein [Sphingomonas bacterium]MDB5705449.1 methylase [Sphingomonas bacterium]